MRSAQSLAREQELLSDEDGRQRAKTQSWWDEDAKCVICLQKIVERGVPFECRVHAYCYECISTWTATTPRCPVCIALITRILKCKTAQEVLEADWTKIRPLKLRQNVLNTLTEEEAELFETSEDDFNSADAENGVESDDHVIPDSSVAEDSGGEDEEETGDRQPPPRRVASSYWDDNLSREPTFTGRRGDSPSDSKGEEEIAFSFVPGEENNDFPVRLKEKDGEYRPSARESAELEALRGSENSRPVTRQRKSVSEGMFGIDFAVPATRPSKRAKVARASRN